jgi:hypothetical protein
LVHGAVGSVHDVVETPRVASAAFRNPDTDRKTRSCRAISSQLGAKTVDDVSDLS